MQAWLKIHVEILNVSDWYVNWYLTKAIRDKKTIKYKNNQRRLR